MTTRFSAECSIWLRILATMNPYFWEIVGGGPQGPFAAGARATHTSLNPQPLPPKEVGAAILNALAMRASLSLNFEQFMEDIDNWCPVPPVHEIDPPRGGGDPDPQPNWEHFLGAAVAAVELAHGLEGEAADQLTKAANQLFEMSQVA